MYHQEDLQWISVLFNIVISYRTARKKEILKAYRKLAAKWHPDKYDGDDKAKAEKMFIDIAAAKEVLTDPGQFVFSF